MFKKYAALVMVIVAAAAVGAATVRGTDAGSPEQKCTAAMNYDVDAFVAHPDIQQTPTSRDQCKGLSEHTATLLFFKVEQSRASDIANAQLQMGH